jgi:hypothetical protein
MDDTTIARTIHVIAVVLWIGGVGFVTTVLLPVVRRMKSPAERLTFFDCLLPSPFFLHRRLREQARAKPETTFRAVERFHWLLLALSLITILGALAGSHGLLLLG